MDFSPFLNFKNSSKKAVFAFFLLFLSFNSFARQKNESVQEVVEDEVTQNSNEVKEEKFDPTVIILEHIGDAHSWHLWGHTSIPLPVILYTPSGLELFSSANLLNEHHKAIPFKGKHYTYLNEEEHIVALGSDGKVDEAVSSKIIDFSITKNVAALFISVIIVLLNLLWILLKQKDYHLLL